jgi:hypothetical protein
MKYIMKVRIPNETRNEKIRDPKFGMKMKDILTEVKVEAVYFTTISGYRGCYAVVNMDDASQIPAIAEPFFIWLYAETEFLPVMTIDDLAKGGPAVQTVNNKWGR